MNMDLYTRQHLEVALEDVSIALSRLGYRVEEIPSPVNPGLPVDLKFTTAISDVKVVYCTCRQITKHTELPYEVAGAITAYCALFYTLNPPPGA